MGKTFPLVILTCLQLGLLGPALAAPSRAFIQEIGRVSSPGNLYLDIYNSTGVWTPAADTQARISTVYGEVLLSPENLGAKVSVMQGLALYAVAGINSSSSESSHAVIGAAYQIRAPMLYVNINPYASHRAGKTRVHSAFALFTPLYLPQFMGETQLGAEFLTSDEPGQQSGVALGLRWSPQDFVTADIVFYGDGGSEDTGALRTPAALRLNLRF